MDDDIYFTPDINTTEIEKALDDEEWSNNVVEAALFGATNCYKEGKTPYQLMDEIILYNVNQKMCKIFLEKAKPFPKIIYWKKSLTMINAYISLESIVAKLALEKKMQVFKATTLNIQIDNPLILKELSTWCAKLKDEFLLEDIQYKKNKNNVYKFYFK